MNTAADPHAASGGPTPASSDPFPRTAWRLRLRRALVSQFGRPTGFWGVVAGWIMALRPSNRERNFWTLELLELRPRDRVLEIGFGPGYAVHRAAELASRGLVAGIDHSQTMLRQARRRNASAVRQGRVDLRLGSVSQLPDFGEPFDSLFAVNSIDFWEAPVERMKSLRRLLRPGGIIAITVQPRSRGATDSTARQAGRRIAGQLTAAGFAEVRTELKPMKPVATVCVLAKRAESR